jgi:hypothetical protein
MNFNEKENNKQKNINTNPINKNRERDREREKERDRDKSENPIEKRGSNSSKNIGQFILGEKLGEGTFGKVRMGTHILTGEKVF